MSICVLILFASLTLFMWHVFGSLCCMFEEVDKGWWMVVLRMLGPIGIPTLLILNIFRR